MESLLGNPYLRDMILERIACQFDGPSSSAASLGFAAMAMGGSGGPPAVASSGFASSFFRPASRSGLPYSTE